MKKIQVIGFAIAVCFCFQLAIAQDEQDQPTSNILQYTPSKLIGKGQWDIKWFNNLYTETESTFVEGAQPRQTFFTSTLEVYTGVGSNKRWNLGTILEFRSNVVAGRGALEVFQFDGETGTARSGLTSIAPSIKFVPIPTVNNFSIQSSFFIPLVDNETEEGVFLDQNGYIWQNRFFYDHTFPGGKWQLFSELNSELSFGKEEDSFANNSLNLTPGLFLSYFPTTKFTVLALAQHSQRIDLGNNFPQDFTAIGGGLKYQLTKELNVEALYTNFVRGSNTGLGETFNIGLRAIL
ncbi:transporter [Muricauda ruestringensis]|uniref:transporter n=1 Tax=Flagellimonas ruestringensis TaxID=111501 RepID=UPI001CD54B9B|nr:transporter [Allomuricauda ruestringensis]MCA0957694.1 transporter [Allomuricauda ruestringensis]